jgi:glutamine synthetase
MKKEEIFKICEQKNVQFVNLQFCDLLGFVKSVTIPISKFNDAIEDHVWFDGSSIEGFSRISESDMYLELNLETFSIVPWQGSSSAGERVARVICSIHLPNGELFCGAPRNILQRQIDRAKKMGFEYRVGPELEFFLFALDEKGDPTTIPNDRAGYFDFSNDRAGAIRATMSKTVSQMGIDVEAIHHEVAQGQHEICFRHSDAITQADAVLTVKTALKAVAEDYGWHATFMPKPIKGVNGSGMHVHQSLMKDGKNIFFDKNGVHHMSEIAQQFIAGQLKLIPEFTAISNPLINSYKRLVMGYEAPVYIAWGQTNRSALIRIPQYREGQEKAVRCELRSPDATANPYLVFAMMLAAGLDGIEQKMKAPDPIDENIYTFTEKKAQRMRVKNLPATLKEAIEKMERSSFAKEVLGEHAFENYIRAKKEEIDGYNLQVSNWELDKYLSIY